MNHNIVAGLFALSAIFPLALPPGQACAQPDDCSDCLAPSDPAALVDTTVALLPPANVLVGAPLLVPVFAYGERCAVETDRPIFISRSFACRPPALRAGTMCLRV